MAQHIEDYFVHRVPMIWKNRPFRPGEDWHLVFTVRDSSDESAIEFESGSGVEVIGSKALITFVAEDTSELPPASYFWDIQAEDLDSDEIRTVASGKLVLLRHITRGRKSTPSEIPDGAITFSGSVVTIDGDTLTLQ